MNHISDLLLSAFSELLWAICRQWTAVVVCRQWTAAVVCRQRSAAAVCCLLSVVTCPLKAVVFMSVTKRVWRLYWTLALTCMSKRPEDWKIADHHRAPNSGVFWQFFRIQTIVFSYEAMDQFELLINWIPLSTILKSFQFKHIKFTSTHRGVL